MTYQPVTPGTGGNLTASMDDLAAKLDALVKRSVGRLDTVADLALLDALESEALGRNSLIGATRGRMYEVDEEDRPRVGALLNDASRRISAALAQRRAELEMATDIQGLREEGVDTTLPARAPARGSHHVIATVMNEMVDIFVSIGYTVATGPEVETEYYNFTALNIPPGHPARLDMDTLYVRWGDDPEGVLLRAHTSPMQARYMEQHDPPVHLVVPGRVFRRDTIDATHQPVFHQLEGLAVAEDVTFTDLKGTLEYFVHRFFGEQVAVRFLPAHFPFTEPSAELHIRLGEGEPWLEMLGCGMVNPAVFEAVGYDPHAVTGFAFGMGVDRFAMLRHGLRDLRELWEGDLRISRQFP
ncbi:MAG: phenylalanine--tRNA ligase subunit alpha [Acidimicrobiia bacterium]